MPLALGVTVLLFAQWPLRDLIGAGSTLANDLAQGMFALYVAVSVHHAGRRREHLVARPDIDANPDGNGPLWRRVGAPLGVFIWANLLLATGTAPAWRSAVSFEHFPDTGNPGYFVVKLALVLLGLLLLVQAVLDLGRALRTR